jgi:hypothetical protein
MRSGKLKWISARRTVELRPNTTFEEEGSVSLVDRSVELFLDGG